MPQDAPRSEPGPSGDAEPETTPRALDGPNRRLLFVLSHPNHEAAIFGMFHRLRPHIVILTDGGGAERVAQSRQGLERIGLLESTSFLDWPEAAFYDALLNHDLPFFRGVASQVGREIEAAQPDQVLCDAVEFYNPVHDLSLPIVRAALLAAGGSPAAATSVPVFEVPLIYQKAGSEECYEVQRLPPSRRAGQIEFLLSPSELADKIWVRDHIYNALREQLRPVLEGLPDEHFATEVIAPAATTLREPASDQTLRYDWRAKLLAHRGEVKRAITRSGHYLPIARELIAGSGLVPGSA